MTKQLQMTREELLEYLKQFNDMYFSTKNRDIDEVEQEVRRIIIKAESLIMRAGFEVHLDGRSRVPSGSRGSRGYYRYYLDEKRHKYIEVCLGFFEKKSKPYGRGRNKKRYTNGFEGMFHYEEKAKSINPRTGEPWKIGDVSYDESGHYRTILTKNGWWSGD